MITDIQHTGRFLETIAESVGRMDDWGYAVALRFGAYDRKHGEASMRRGGPFSITCGFRVSRESARWLLFAITVTPKPEECVVTVEVEEEDEEQSLFHWESPPTAASSLVELRSTIGRAFEILDGSIELPHVAKTLSLFRQNA